MLRKTLSPTFTSLCAAIGSLILCVVSAQAAETKAGGVNITQLEGKLRIEINGKLFTEYCYQGAPHVYYYPLLGPGGAMMTRHAPMKKVEGEDQDHPHHRSLWYSHGDVNGVDFWAESAKSGKIVHDKFLEIKSGAEQGVIRSANSWVAPDGKVVCTDEQVFRVFNRPDNERLFDYEITLKAGAAEVVLGDTKEGTMAIRLAETMRLKPNKFNQGKPAGHIVQDTGVVDGATWGKRAAWCDYSGPVDGKTLGVAIFDHPSNPKHPTWWHVRDYGLFAANPFGVHDFEKKPLGTGNLSIPAGGSVTFRYRFYIHEGDEKAAQVAERYAAYAKGPLALLYQQDFKDASALKDFAMSDVKAWKLASLPGQEAASGSALELAKQSQYSPSVRSPVNIALIADKVFGDFVLEADLRQTGREYGHRDMCLFFGFQDPTHFYYAHIATKADDHAHNIFIVKDAPRIKIAEKTTEGVQWGLDVWRKVRLERETKEGLIRIFYEDMTTPIMVARDVNFTSGYVGFGSFDDTGMVDNIRIWGPAVEGKPTRYFARP